jgi:hypothetical protein
MLVDGGLLKILAEPLDIGRDVQRLDVGELAEFVLIAPGEEPREALLPASMPRGKRMMQGARRVAGNVFFSFDALNLCPFRGERLRLLLACRCLFCFSTGHVFLVVLLLARRRPEPNSTSGIAEAFA